MAKQEPPRLQYDTPNGYDKNINIALAKLQTMHDVLEALERNVILKKQEIEEFWKSVPALKVRKWVPCIQCHRPTQDRFGGVAKCRKHVHKDPGVAAVLEEFLYGKD